MKTKLIPFDAEKAKNGAKVVTRNGLPAKILDYPVKNEDSPILGLILIEGKEFPKLFTKNGNHYSDCTESRLDLFIEEEEVEEDDSDYDPYKATVEYIADMVKRYSELQSIEELKDFYNNVRVKCQDAFDYGKVCMINQDEEPADNKPKFKVGDWIIDGLGIVHRVIRVVENVGSHTYGYDTDDGFYIHDSASGVRLWDINDAKPGDVLATKNGYNILIFKNIKSSSGSGFSSYYNYNNFSDDSDFREGSWDRNCFMPATKEQCDTLFQKMKEAGYYWDSDKKELKKIEEAKTRRMTQQEFSRWLRDYPGEHREYMVKGGHRDYTAADYNYPIDEADEEIGEVYIRRNGGEWEEPLINIK